MSDEKIISIHGGGIDLAITKKSVEPRKYCEVNCMKIEIDPLTRTIVCLSCGQSVQPFDYILEWANRGDQRMKDLTRLDQEIRLKRGDVAVMEREYQRLRRAVDKLDRPTRKAVEQERFDARYNPHQSLKVMAP